MSGVPKEMGKRVQEELQKVLNEWSEHIPSHGAYENPEFQKIELQKKEKK